MSYKHCLMTLPHSSLQCQGHVLSVVSRFSQILWHFRKLFGSVASFANIGDVSCEVLLASLQGVLFHK